jgi:hypothetical protein
MTKVMNKAKSVFSRACLTRSALGNKRVCYNTHHKQQQRIVPETHNRHENPPKNCSTTGEARRRDANKTGCQAPRPPPWRPPARTAICPSHSGFQSRLMSNEIAPTMAVANGDAAGAMDYIEIVSGKKHHLQATTKKMCSSNKPHPMSPLTTKGRFDSIEQEIDKRRRPKVLKTMHLRRLQSPSPTVVRPGDPDQVFTSTASNGRRSMVTRRHS